MPGLGNLIDDVFRGRFMNSAKCVSDVGRKHFSQAVGLIALCREIDLAKLDAEKREILAKSVVYRRLVLLYKLFNMF